MLAVAVVVVGLVADAWFESSIYCSMKPIKCHAHDASAVSYLLLFDKAKFLL